MKKKSIVFLFALIAAIACLSFSACGMFGIGDNNGDGSGGGGGSKPEFASGTGEEDAPYEINQPYQWFNVSKHPASHFQLSADINLGDYDSVSPVGTAQTPFEGNIDGKNHKIVGAKISAHHNAGLFGVVSGATIKNLVFSDSRVVLGKDYNDGEYVASFVAVARKGTLIENCHTKNVGITFPSKTSYFTFVGGFAGSVESVSSTLYCSSNVQISLSSGGSFLYPGFHIGGFALRVSGSTVDCCQTSGSITFGSLAGRYVMRIGAFIDTVTNSKITNMLTEMNVTVGSAIDAYTIACKIDEETLKYCLNFNTYQRSPKGRYASHGLLSNMSEDVNIYFPSSEYANANGTLDKSLWKDNAYWKKGTLHPELVSYQEYLQIKSAGN